VRYLLHDYQGGACRPWRARLERGRTERRRELAGACTAHLQVDGAQGGHGACRLKLVAAAAQCGAVSSEPETLLQGNLVLTLTTAPSVGKCSWLRLFPKA